MKYRLFFLSFLLTFTLYSLPLREPGQLELSRKIQQCDFPDWMLEQIEDDFNTVVIKDTETILDFEQNRFFQEPSYVLFIIEENQISFKARHDISNGLKNRIHQIFMALSDLARCIKLPNVNFILDVSDGCLQQEPYNEFPVFAFSKKKNQKGIILFPDPATLGGRLEKISGFPCDIIQEMNTINMQCPWEKKIEKIVWRGSNTDGFRNKLQKSPRIKLAKLSKNFPEFIDAGFTVILGNEEVRRFLEPYKKLPLDLRSQVEYKYQILIDGATTSWSRSYWQLLSGSVVFKQNSSNMMWYYGALKPYTHYIPINRNMEDVIQKVSWARAHDEYVRKIAENATYFAKNYLSYTSQLLYIYLLLIQYSRLATATRDS